MTDTPRWTLPLLMAGQAQKEIAHNEALLAIDRVLHLAVKERTVVEPPREAGLGDTLIIGPGPAGAWAGCAGRLASFDGSGWIVTAPREGCLAWIKAEAALVVYHADGWHVVGTLARAT